MQIREVTILNFRGIGSFWWQPTSALTCIVGAGDSCKSTILDAIEIALTSRWFPFADVDFTDGDTNQTIEITVTVGQLPEELLRENRMGLHLRGWSAAGVLRDEPEDNDEAVVTVRLTVDASLEPAWELITDRGDPRPLSARDRALFGVVRLGGEVERHLTWVQGSALSRLSSEREAATLLLADAYRKARDLLRAGSLPALDALAVQVRDEAIKLGAYAGTVYSAGLDTQRSSMSLGSLSMHSDGIPLRLAGLGTRRLVALAVQQMSIPEGAIVLIDEIEHGLEPHRIRHALKVLRDSLADGFSGTRAGQVILTTHSATSVVELSCDQLAVCRCDSRNVELRSPNTLLQPLVRRTPEAFLSRRVLVCEGKTEIGIVRGLRDLWASRHHEEPLEARGVVLVDGNGSEAAATACALSDLGYGVALLRDSDVTLTPKERSRLNGCGIQVFEWEGALSTEERILLDVSREGVQLLLNIAYEYFGEERVIDSVCTALGIKENLGATFSSWAVPEKSEGDLRKAIGQAAKKNTWLKRVEPGERAGSILASELVKSETSSMASTLRAAETWIYSG